MPPSPRSYSPEERWQWEFLRILEKFSKILEFRELEWGQFIIENLLRVILENSRNSKMRMRLIFSRVLASLGGGKEHLGNLFNMHDLVGRSATSGADLLWRFLNIDDVHTCLHSQNLNNNITLNKIIDKIWSLQK